MSIWAVNWALHTEVPNPTHKLVLLALANFADENDEAWPKVSTLAEIASSSARTVQRALVELEEAGLLTRVMGMTAGAHGGGLRKVNTLYRLSVPDDVSRRSSDRVGRPASLRVVGDAAATVSDEEQVDETASGIRYDMGVISEIQCDTGDAIQCDTGDAPYKEEPSVRTTNLTPQAPHGGAGGVGSGPVVVDDASADGADWSLVRSCLPEGMQGLDGPSVARIAGLLRQRVEAGWSHRALREILAGNALPSRIRHLSGLVVHRISQIPVAAAPVDRQSVSARMEERGEGVVPEWVQRRRAAIEAGLPEGQQPLAWWVAQGVGHTDGNTQQPSAGVGKGNKDR